jgi:uracil-DNA glycosylase
MSFELDERQRAMLAEMGIRLFDEALVGGGNGASRSTARVGVTEAGPTPPSVPGLSKDSQGFDELGPDRGVRLAPDERPTPGRGHQPTAIETSDTPDASRGPIEVMTWEALAETVAGCQACGLCQSRRNTVFGVGDQQADWLIIGEAPGENEDLQGEPFVGQAGKLLDNMLRALGLDRQRGVYIANVLKCRPPGNRNPEPEEVARCEPYLRRQVELLKPKIILAMGRFAVQALLQTTEPIGRLRGRMHRYGDVPLVVTYHPAYLLRNLPDKAKAWADLCLAMEWMEQAR